MSKRFFLPTVTAMLCFFNCLGGIGASEISIVVPNQFANTEGDWAVTDLIPDYRLQMIVAADQFNELPSGDNLLTHLAYRVNGELDEPHTYTFDRMTLRLSTTTTEVGQLSNEFALNVGQDELVVFDGQRTWLTDGAGPAGGPKGFDFGLPVDPPFSFDPRQGNLLIDLTVVGGSSPLNIDFTIPTSDASRFIWTGDTGVDSPVAQAGSVFGGDILELEFQIIPEPSGFLLAVIAILAMGCCLHGRVKGHVKGQVLT